MIEFLRGVILEVMGTQVVLDVGGVGYGLTVPATTGERLGDPGAEASLWVRTYVREDVLRLYGFATRHEREVFDVFLGLSGVGPSIGLAILSHMSVAEVVQATVGGDAARFKAVKGVGPKMAEKLLLELKGRVDRLAAGLEPADAAAVRETPVPEGEAARDAVAALEALDIRPIQARRAVALAIESLGKDATVEALVREGLKHRRST